MADHGETGAGFDQQRAIGPTNATCDGGQRAANITLQSVSFSDIAAILWHGLKDWARAPFLSIALAGVYTLGGWLLAALMIFLDLPYLVYPLAMGFALIAPFVAIAFYDVSRRLQDGTPVSFGRVIATVNEIRKRDLRWMALITAFAFFIWMDIAAMLTLGFFGATALDFGELVTQIFDTSTGWTFLVVGHVVGAIIALLVFSISVVTYPMLYDRDIDVMTAMITSVRLVAQNPVAMALWCALIAAMIGLALISGLILLPLVLPVLGYASWHLYTRTVGTAASSQIETA